MWHSGAVSTDRTLDDLVDSWLTVPDLALKWGISVTAVRGLIEEREILAVRRGERNVLCVPAEFAGDGGPVPALRGTFTVLADAGLRDPEVIAWLFTRDDTLPGGPTPMAALLAGHKSEVRKRAMEEAF